MFNVQTDKYVYKKIELGSLINKETIKEEIDSDVELNRVDVDSGDENQYRELIINNASKIESTSSQIEQMCNTVRIPKTFTL